MIDSRTQPERRIEERAPIQASARIFYGPDLAIWADCTIRDRSGVGAKVEVGALYQLPARLVLVDTGRGVACDAVVRWRRGDMAGLKFEAQHDLRQPVKAELAGVQIVWSSLRPTEPTSTSD